MALIPSHLFQTEHVQNYKLNGQQYNQKNPVPGKQIILGKRHKDLPFFQKLADKNITQKT